MERGRLELRDNKKEEKKRLKREKREKRQRGSTGVQEESSTPEPQI